MHSDPSTDVYSPDEIALAAGVPLEAVCAAIGSWDALVPFAQAVEIGRGLAAAEKAGSGALPLRPLFSIFSPETSPTRSQSLRLIVSSTLHLAVLAMFAVTVGLTPKAATLPIGEHHPESMRLAFLPTVGPGGGGGGGGLLQKATAPRAQREGKNQLSSPLPARVPPKPLEPALTRPEPKPAPLEAERLPPLVAPVLAVPSDTRNRTGVLDQAKAEADSHGSGRDGGSGTGVGTGIGEGAGPGIGPGSGGGIGGGPYRPGSGIAPPRVLREVKADYTEEARRRGLEGDVVLEIVVQSDGSVGDAKVLQGLGAGLSERAMQAVRQWRFAPAVRQGVPIAVIVEVAVEFKLR
jgi:protein TonB